MTDTWKSDEQVSYFSGQNITGLNFLTNMFQKIMNP